MRTPRPTAPESPRWTSDKASLVAEYIHRFLFVTKHGVYLDLFAAPQSREDQWCARNVLKRRTKGPAITHYAVCDRSARGAAALRRLATESTAEFLVYEGDANVEFHRMLSDAPIKPSTPCFCLIDQRTFQCHWSTVQAIADFKQAGTKVEMFYFLAQAWIDRAYRALRSKRPALDWWGGQESELRQFLALPSVERAYHMCGRFTKELGYKHAQPFSIHERGKDSRTMYYMILASDHDEAVQLMARAYNTVPSREQQAELANLSIGKNITP